MSKFNKIIFFHLASLIFVGSVSFLLFSKDQEDPKTELLILLIVTSLIGLLILGSLLQRLWEHQVNPKASERWANQVEKVAPWMVKPFAQDVNSYKLITKHPRVFIWIPIATSLALATGLWRLFGGLDFTEDLSLTLYLIVLFVASFTSVLLFFTGFMISAELLQRRLWPSRQSFAVEMLFNYWRALPLLLLMSITLIIFLLIHDDDNTTIPDFSTWRDFLTIAGLIVFKYYIYLNLAAYAFSEPGERLGYRATASLMRRQEAALFKIWVSGGVSSTFAIFFAIFSVLGMVTNYDFFVGFAGISLLLALLIQACSEQIHVLLHYVKIKHPNLKKELKTFSNTQA